MVVNGLPLEFNLNVMEAALEVGASYMDLSGPMEEIGFVESYQWLFSEWHERFRTKGLLALVGVAVAIGAEKLVFLCDAPGLLDAQGKLVSSVTADAAARALADEAVCGFTPVAIGLDRAGIAALLRDAERYVVESVWSRASTRVTA